MDKMSPVKSQGEAWRIHRPASTDFSDQRIYCRTQST
jgi:hypothetical protein